MAIYYMCVTQDVNLNDKPMARFKEKGVRQDIRDLYPLHDTNRVPLVGVTFLRPSAVTWFIPLKPCSHKFNSSSPSTNRQMVPSLADT